MKNGSKKLIYLTGCILFVMLSITSAHAGVWCESGTVTQTGANPFVSQYSSAASEFVIYMTCEDSSGGWATERRFVILENESKKANFATALSAAVSGNSVRVLLGATTADSLIEIIYLKKN